MSVDIKILVNARPDKDLKIEQRHNHVMMGMSHIDAPLGFSGLEIPKVPECGDKLVTSYGVNFKAKGINFVGTYNYRGTAYVYEDFASYDEHFDYKFKLSNKAVDYRCVLNGQLPKIVTAFGAYKARVSYDKYGFYYCGGMGDDNSIYNKLRESKEIDVDGRNNIYTLYPAQFWDAELCQRALGYGPEEVIARLQGRVQRVERLLDGVYLLINDDPNLSYDEFVEMNERVKPILGLI